MSQLIARCLLGLFIIIATLTAPFAIGQAAAEELSKKTETSSCSVWTPFEINLQSLVEYPQPDVWLTLQLNATFVHEALSIDNTTGRIVTTTTVLSTPGFWDGGLVWKVGGVRVHRC